MSCEKMVAYVTTMNIIAAMRAAMSTRGNLKVEEVRAAMAGAGFHRHDHRLLCVALPPQCVDELAARAFSYVTGKKKTSSYLDNHNRHSFIIMNVMAPHIACIALI